MFKRVDNYIAMNEIDEFITLMRKDSADVPEIITGLINVLYMDEESARKHVQDFFAEHRILNGELIDNIGFPILITLQKAKNQLNIVTSNINNVHYIKYYRIIMML